MATKNHQKYIFINTLWQYRRSKYMKIIYANADMLFYFIFIFLTIVLLVLKISKYKRNFKVVKVIKYILAIPVVILNMLIFGDLNISLQLFKDENKTDNKK